ncbi:MAG: spore maturation protein [Ignavibacteriales bacterium]|nr:spore maturation protein [Ignavibacteriales bacterium]
MLNYLWMGLLLLGIGVAVTTDIIDTSNNKYKNGQELQVEILVNEDFNKDVNKTYDAVIKVDASQFSEFYDVDVKKDFEQVVKITVNKEKKKYTLFFKVNENTPEIWVEMAGISGKDDDLMGEVKIKSLDVPNQISATIILEKVSFTKLKAVTNSAIRTAGIAVEIAIGLIGIMALWLGVMKIAEEAGLMRIIARSVRPITKFLFPEVPQDHPAIGSMIMNISANMLGLGNAATPFGLKAMQELQELNPKKDTATNAMCTFLAINTAGLTLIPATAIAIRAAMGSSEPTIIIGTSIFGALCATTTGILSAKLFEKFPIPKGYFTNFIKKNLIKLSIFLFSIALIVILAIAGVFSALTAVLGPDIFKDVINTISIIAIPTIIFLFVLYGLFKKVRVYETFVEGAKEGFNVAVKIIPYLVGMLVAIAIFRAGGVMDILVNYVLKYPAELIGMPPEALPMALIRPLSGSGSTGVMTEIMAVHGTDSFLGILSSTFFGSTETTFYVLAVYFGSVQVKKTRHALPVGLLADIAGILGALFIVKLLFG